MEKGPYMIHEEDNFNRVFELKNFNEKRWETLYSLVC